MVRAVILLVMLASVSIADQGNVRRMGDHFQILLPVTGLACAAVSGQALPYLGRYFVMEGVLTSSKEGLGTHPLNLRPDGHTRGFPSGHTAAAAFGAAGLAKTCLSSNRVAAGIVGLAAVFTGYSRIEAGRHYLFQVIFGGLVGWGAQVLTIAQVMRALRRLRHRIPARLSRHAQSE